jgi:hypothetical protein
MYNNIHEKTADSHGEVINTRKEILYLLPRSADFRGRNFYQFRLGSRDAPFDHFPGSTASWDK